MAERSYPTSEVREGGGEEIPSVRGQRRQPGGDTPRPHAQGQGRWPEDQPDLQGAMAAQAQEGLEELSHIEGQEGRR